MSHQFPSVFLCAVGVLHLAAGVAFGSQLGYANQPRSKSEYLDLLKRADEVRIHRHVPPRNPTSMDPGSWNRRPLIILAPHSDPAMLGLLAQVQPVKKPLGVGMPVDAKLVLVVAGKPRETGYSLKTGEFLVGRNLYRVPPKFQQALLGKVRN
jgi:hypothetical protein